MHSFLLKGKVHSDKHLKDFYKAETTKEEKAPGYIPATEELLPLKEPGHGACGLPSRHTRTRATTSPFPSTVAPFPLSVSFLGSAR